MAYQFHNVTILVVEDNQPMLDIVKSLLLTFGVGRVVSAKNGVEGLKKLVKYDPDIVIADWMMKPLDGISFASEVRQNKQAPNPFVPIILMTGFSQKSRVLQARDAGVTEFLVKPFNARDLYRRIVQIIERPRQFVRTEGFFGPDRRRQQQQNYGGPLRREEDKRNAEYAKQRLQAQKTLARIRSKAGLGKGDKFNPSDIEMVEGR